MTRKIQRFDAAELIQAVEETRDSIRGAGKITLKTTEIPLPPLVEHIRPRQITEIRRRLNVSQPVFAQILNVPVVTAVSWEKGRRHPSGAALRLLQIARQHPEVLLRT